MTRPEQPATAAGKKLAAFITGLAGGGYSHAEAAVADVEREAAAAALPDVEELAAALHRIEGPFAAVGPVEQRLHDKRHAEWAAAILSEIERARG